MSQQDPVQLEQQWLTQFTGQAQALVTHFSTLLPGDRRPTPAEITLGISYLQNQENDFRKYEPIALSLKASGFSQLSEQLEKVLTDLHAARSTYVEMYQEVTAKAICIVPDVSCHDCVRQFSQLPYDIHIDSIEAIGASWVLHGSGKSQNNIMQVSHRCPMCGKIYEAIQYIIPIECAPYPCPICGQSQALEYKIRQIQSEKDSFQFEAVITCEKCGKKRAVQEVLKKVLGVLKVTVGPTGITVRKG